MLGTDFQLPLDAAGFSSRACPRCGAEFKVRWTQREARVLAGALAARVEHLNRGEAIAESSVRHCPYCAAMASADAWWTPEQRQWLAVQAADLDREVRWRRLRVPLDRLAENPRPTYLVVEPDRASAHLTDEEREHLVALPLPCCGEELKVSDDWVGPVRCHFCGFVHARAVHRDPGLELAQLREWIASR